MGVIWTSKTRTRQPQVEVPLLVKPAWVFLPTVPIELVSGTPVTYGSSGPPYTPSSEGRAFTTAAASSGNLYGEIAHSTSLQITGEAVFVMRIKVSAGAGTRISKTVDNGATDSEYDFVAYEYLGAGVLTVALTRVGSSGGFRTWGLLESTYRPPADKWVTLSVYAPPLVETAPRFFADGVEVGTVVDIGGTGSGVPDVCSSPIRFNKRADLTTFNDQSQIAIAYAIQGVGPLAAKQFSANPWQIFAPERRPIFFSTPSGGSTVTGVGSSDGVGTASGVGASTANSVGSSSGTGTASGTGASTANSVGSSTGIGTADGVGSSTGGSDGAGSSSGTGTATGVGASTAASVGSTDGVGTASGVGDSIAASTGSASGTGTATGVGENGSVTISGVGSASGTGTALGIAPSHGGGNGTGRNLSRKQKKKLKAVESQEWLKAEETARQLLNDRFTKQTPQEKAEALQTYVESLQPVIEALKALTTQIEEVKEVVEDAPVMELTPHQEILSRFDTLEKKLKSVEELVIILMADL